MGVFFGGRRAEIFGSEGILFIANTGGLAVKLDWLKSQQGELPFINFEWHAISTTFTAFLATRKARSENRTLLLLTLKPIVARQCQCSRGWFCQGERSRFRIILFNIFTDETILALTQAPLPRYDALKRTGYDCAAGSNYSGLGRQHDGGTVGGN